MNRHVALLTLAVLAMIGATAGSIRWLRSRLRLGEPGVRVVRLPVLSDSGRVAGSNSVFLPPAVAGFRSEMEPIPEMELGYLPADTTYGRRTYQMGDGLPPVSASVVLMGTDRTSIHRPEYCVRGVGWRIDSERTAKIPVKSVPAFDLEVQRFDVSREFELDGGRRVKRGGVYVFWFRADGARTASHRERQWRMIRDVLSRGEVPRWAYLAFFSLCEPGGEDAAFARVSRLVGEAVPQMESGTDAARATAAVDPH